MNADVAVLAAAASSSAAAGAQASQTVELYQGAVSSETAWIDAYELSRLAPGFDLGASPIAPAQPANDTQPRALATKKFVRLTDGGFLDNSGVAHLINFLQKNGESTFNVIAFDNVQQFYTPSGQAETRVPVDVAYLFGQGPPNVPPANPTKFDSKVFCGGKFLFWELCVPVPLQQIFEPGPLTTPAAWTYPCAARGEVSYTRYENVVTVDNPTLGVKKGMSGSLHVFAAIFPQADTAPNEDTADWNEYQFMLECIYDGMVDHGGARFFRAALQP